MLDIFTLLVACCSLMVFLGGMFIYFWARDRAVTALLWWGLPLMLGGAALVFYARPGWQNDFLSISMGNALRMVAVGALWEGLRLFHGRQALIWPIAVTVMSWMLLCLVPGVTENMLLRIIAVSLVNVGFCAGSVYELWRGREEALPSRIPLLLVFVSFALLMLGRAGVAPFTPFPFGTLPADGLWLGAFMFIVFAHAAFAAVLFISLIRERREETQRNFAMSDPLTGLMNRRAFQAYAERAARRRTSRQAMALLVLDIDHFKSINDRFGHETGDRMLAAFAQVAEDSVRPADQLFRMGGEEFCFVLPDTSLADAIEVAERIRTGFERREMQSGAGAARTTVSVGIAATDHAIDLELMLAAADAAVYEAKARGRNRVVVAEPGALLRRDAETGLDRRRA
ncbi:MAG: GGDEF domain-containing protein [Devosia sp.]